MGGAGLENYLLGLPGTSIFLISASQVARVTDVSHWCPAGVCFFDGCHSDWDEMEYFDLHFPDG
jgi:hypothetical protein